MIFLYFFIAFAIIIGLYYAVESSVKHFVDKKNKKHENKSAKMVSKRPLEKVTYEYVRVIYSGPAKNTTSSNESNRIVKYKTHNKGLIKKDKKPRVLRLDLKRALERSNQERFFHNDWIKLHSSMFFEIEIDGTKYHIINPCRKRLKIIPAIIVNRPPQSLAKIELSPMLDFKPHSIKFKKPLFGYRSKKKQYSSLRHRKSNIKGAIPDET